MFPELRGRFIDKLESAYTNQKAPELDGTPAYSEQFFTDWRENGLFHAFNGLQTFVRCYGENNSPLPAFVYTAQTLARSLILATGLTEYAQNVKTAMEERELSTQEKIGLGLYHGTIGYFMSARRYINDPPPEESEESEELYKKGSKKTPLSRENIPWDHPDANKPVWGVTNYAGTILVVHGAGEMTLKQAVKSLDIVNSDRAW